MDKHLARLLSVVAALASTAFGQTGNVVKYHAGINDVKYVYGVADPVARLKARRHSRYKYARLFRQRAQKAGRHFEHGQRR